MSETTWSTGEAPAWSAGRKVKIIAGDLERELTEPEVGEVIETIKTMAREKGWVNFSVKLNDRLVGPEEFEGAFREVSGDIKIEIAPVDKAG